MKKSNKLNIFLENKTMLFLIVCLLRLILDYIYCKIVSPYYDYLGLTVSNSIVRLICSWIMTFIFYYLIKILSNLDAEKHKGSIVLMILLCCSAIPTTTIVAYFDVDMYFILYNLIYWILIVLFYRLNFKRAKISILKVRSNLFIYIVAIIYMVAILLICLRYTGFNISFDLSNVYEARSAFKTDNIPTILQYLFFSSTVIFPIILIYALNYKKNILAISMVIFQLFAFFADGRKSTLFMLFLTVIGYYAIKKFNNKMVPFGILIITFIGFAEYLIFHSSFIVNYLIRRLFLLPSYLQYAYYEFFSINTKDFLAQSIFGRIGLKSVYDEPIPLVIGKNYYGGSYANNGLFSDAFSNFGFLGVLVYPLLIASSLKYLDQCSDKLSIGLCIGVIFTASYTLLSTSFFTVMITHGFIICCIVINLMPRFRKAKKDEDKI